MEINEEINLKEQNIKELNEELDSLFTKSAIRILKIKGFTFSVSVACGVLILFAISDVKIFSNALINAMYALTTIGIPLLTFGNPLENKKVLEANKAKIAEIVDVKEPELKKEIASLQESLNLKRENDTGITMAKSDNISYSNTDALENDMASRSPKEKGPVLKLTKNPYHTDNKN